MAKNVIVLASGGDGAARSSPSAFPPAESGHPLSRTAVLAAWPPDIPISVGAGRAWFARLHRLEDKYMNPFDRKRSIAPVELGARGIIAGYTVPWRWPSNRGSRAPGC